MCICCVSACQLLCAILPEHVVIHMPSMHIEAPCDLAVHLWLWAKSNQLPLRRIQLAVDVQIPPTFGGLGAAAVYIGT